VSDWIDRAFTQALAAGFAASATSCGTLIPCSNGEYGPASYRHEVKRIPSGLDPNVPSNPPEAWCEAACGDSRCQVADVGSGPEAERRVVCHVYTASGCGSLGMSGRMTAGVELPRRAAAPRGLGARLARMAELEEASIHAFEALAVELRRRRAPPELVDRALEAADDERRHARVVGQLAGARGGVVGPVRAEVPRNRATVALAIENATEGCVGETLGALVVAYQSRAAEDFELRKAFRRIAGEEQEHARLAFDLHAFFGAKLSAAERCGVIAAMRTAAERAMRTRFRRSGRVARALGLPPDVRPLARLVFGQAGQT
jgi:hypothetical protein